MNLNTLLALGCYVNAGHVDYYDGKHIRLGDVTAAGDLVMDAAEEAAANQIVAGSLMEALAAEAPVIGVTMTPLLQRVEPEAPSAHDAAVAAFVDMSAKLDA